jgi:hypothetical protein
VVEKRDGIAMPLKKPRLGFEWQSSTVVVSRTKVQNFSEVYPKILKNSGAGLLGAGTKKPGWWAGLSRLL